jgi:hypothetical protein
MTLYAIEETTLELPQAFHEIIISTTQELKGIVQQDDVTSPSFTFFL